ncbi:MAG: amino acid adenylation domain-containing protein [bacterium]|nr:amino acid adenylation domain-containing protein [bacterium]
MLLKKFEEQAARTPRNIAVKTDGITHTYSELNRFAIAIARLISKTVSGETVGLLFDHGVDMIAAILGALKAGKIYVPLSVDYPENRLSYMLSDSESSLIVTGSAHGKTAARLTAKLNIPVLIIDESRVEPGAGDEKRRVDAVAGAGDGIAYILYTSGSTGKPKGVYQTHGNADYYVRNWIRLFSITSVDRMTLFSSFCHDGSVQDMFSALHTGAALYPLHLKNRESSVELARFLIEEGITIWHSVPSLYGFFTGTLTGGETFPLLRWILLGGEPVREHETGMLNRYFPHSTLANVYGQTESSVSSVCVIRRGEAYGVPQIGTPLDETEILVIDKGGDPVGPLQTGEILIGSPYISPGYWKNPGATSAVFAGDEEFGRLYWTGDLGRLLVDGGIEFLGRRDHQVKIRGFRVEPGEIETRLLQHQAITEAVVILREDERGDKYLCAYVVRHSPHSTNSTELREFLSQELPDYMVPSYFVQLEKMPLTPSGKIDRKALPVPVREESTIVCIAPRDEVEKKLLELWEEVLNTNGFGIDDNFFELGGHSLKAAVTAGRIRKALNVKVILTEIFRNPTIRALAKYIKQSHREVYASVETAEKREYYTASAMQKRLFILDQLEGAKTAYNLPGVVTVKGKLNRQALETAVHKLIARHESLRTSFHMIDDQPVQKIQKIVGTEHCSVRTTIINKFIRPFDLSKAPLLRVGLVLLAEEEHLLLFDMHHIISDGTSMGILIRDMAAFYEGREPGALTVQYKDFSGWQAGAGGKAAMEKQEAYWLNRFAGEVPRLAVFTDYPRPGVQSFEGASLDFNFGNELKTKIEQLMKETGTTLYMVLLAVYTILLSRYARQEDIVVGTPAAGRQHPDFEGIIGLFINALSMRNYPQPGKTFSGFLEEVKENTLQAYENQGYPFDRLIGKLAVADDFSRNPLFDAELVVQNMEITKLKAEGLTFEPYPYESGVTQVDLALYVVETDDNIDFSLKYCTALFKKETMERFADFFQETAAAVVENRDIRLEDIEIAHELETMTTDAYNNSDSSFDF